MNPRQNYPHIIEFPACILNMFVKISKFVKGCCGIRAFSLS